MKTINPGMKMLSVIIASLLLSVTFNIRLNVLVCAVCLTVTFLTPGVNRRKLLVTMLPFLIAAWGMFMAGLIFGRHGDSNAGVELTVFGQRTLFASGIKTGMQLASRILAYGGLGLLYAFTSDAFALIMSLMQQFRLPPKFAYGILAAYHFFPVIHEEYGIVGAAMKVRGAKGGPLSTKRLIPMLVQAMERSSSLAMAMESRGFENGAPRSVAFRVPLRARDGIFLVVLNALIIAGLIFIR